MTRRAPSGYNIRVELPSVPTPEAALEDMQARARALRETLGRAHSRLVWSVLICFGASACIGLATAFGSLRDGAMFAAMYLVCFSYIFVYLKAWLARRPVFAAIGLFLAEATLAFFTWILTDRVPARRIADGDAVVLRPELPLLWVAAGLLALSALLLLAHWVTASVLRRRTDRSVTQPKL